MNMEPIATEAVLQRPPTWSAGDVSFWNLGTQGSNNLWLGRFGPESVGQRSPWERHPQGQELLHVLAGAVQVTLLVDSRQIIIRLDAGSIFVVPSAVWHSHTPLASTIEFGATPGKSQHSTAADPRVAAE